MAKQSYGKTKIAIKRSGRRSVRTRTCNKGTDAHAIKESIKSNRNIDIDNKGTAAKHTKGTAAAIKRTTLLPAKICSTGSSKQIGAIPRNPCTTPTEVLWR